MISVEATAVTAPPGTILLDAYAARSCPVKTQNAYNPTVGERRRMRALRSRPATDLPSCLTAVRNSRQQCSTG